MSAPIPASLSTFTHMHTREDLSAADAAQQDRDDAYARGDVDGDDEIVQELPIVLSQTLGRTLYLMQSPLRPPHRPYDADLGPRLGLRVKPIQKRVEMEFRTTDAGINHQPSEYSNDVPRSHNYDADHAYPVTKLTLNATAVLPKTNYCAGVLSNGILHLTPLHAVCRFRPELGYIDASALAAQADSEAKREAHKFERLREGRMTEEEEMEMEEENYIKVKEEENKRSLSTVVMKVERKKPAPGSTPSPMTTGGFAKRQTYGYLKQLEEKEDWIPLTVHDPKSSQSRDQFSLLLSSTTFPPPPIPFNVSSEHYLSYVNPRDAHEDEQGSNAASHSANNTSAMGDPLFMTFDERLLLFMRNARIVQMSEIVFKLKIVTDEQCDHAIDELGVYCHLVQSCWVIKSGVLYDRNWKSGMPVPSSSGGSSARGGSIMSSMSRSSLSSSRPVADRLHLTRDFLLTQFARRRTIYRDEIESVAHIELEPLDDLLNELAVKVALTDDQLRHDGIPRSAQWEWKVPTDYNFKQHFSKIVAQSEQVTMPTIESEIRHLLATSTIHPSRDSSSRGMLLPNSQTIVHALAPAGFVATRGTPSNYVKR